MARFWASFWHNPRHFRGQLDLQSDRTPMPTQNRITRFIKKPFGEKWAAIKATYSSLSSQIANAARRVWYATVDASGRRRQLFRDVYKNKTWGDDGYSIYFSGVGSRGEVAKIYIQRIAELLREHASQLGRPLTIVDLGCGDFAVGRALVQEIPDCVYIGCDIVPELIKYNNTLYADSRVSFHEIDIVSDRFPQGDVCLIRQVLQHLSNTDIARVLGRLDYKYIYVTEGHPPERSAGAPNPDKATGFDIRFDWARGFGRGVELDKPPFNVQLEEIFRASIPGHEITITSRLHPLP
jgi:hypothetical protein